MKRYNYIRVLYFVLFLATMPQVLFACCGNVRNEMNNNGMKSCCKTMSESTEKSCGCCNKTKKSKHKSCEGNCNKACHCGTSVSGFAFTALWYNNDEHTTYFPVLKNDYNSSPLGFLSSDFASIWVPPKIKAPLFYYI